MNGYQNLLVEHLLRSRVKRYSCLRLMIGELYKNDYMWNLLDSTRQGRSHVKQGTPCQDKTYCQSYDDVYVITLADGAGSARLSHYGAKCVTKCIADELGWNFESYWDETEARIAKERLFQEISGSLQQIAELHDCQLKDLASTLLAVAVKDERYIILHLGDGVIGYSKEGLLKVASADRKSVV